MNGLADVAGGVDERACLGGQHVDQVVLRLVAVMPHRAVLVKVVVELEVAVPGYVPLVPAGRDRIARHVAVQVLAHHRGAVAGRVQRHRPRFPLVAVGVEGGVPAVGAGVGEDPVVVRVLAGEDGRTRRAAQRVDHVVLRHRGAALFQA